LFNRAKKKLKKKKKKKKKKMDPAATPTTPQGWENYKNVRALSAVANALALGGGLSLLGYMILHDNTVLRCGTADGQDCEVNDDGTLAGGTPGYDDDALAKLIGSSGAVSAIVSLIVMILLWVAMRMISKARKLCKLVSEHTDATDQAWEYSIHDGDDSESHEMRFRKLKNSSRGVIIGQLVGNLMAWGLNFLLGIFLIIDWGRDCAGASCDPDTAVPLTIASFFYCLLVFVGQTIMAGVLIWMLIVHNKICEKVSYVSKMKSKVRGGWSKLRGEEPEAAGQMANAAMIVNPTMPNMRARFTTA
jgi:hypothetical protein